MKTNIIRNDIQGLRAVAVLAVMIFHAFPTVLPGGYIGVDIFFVISGYVITRSIDRAKETGNFTIAQFYRQRVRRIFPALYSVILATFLVGAFLLAPNDFKELAKTAGATALFGSNILFANLAHYFDGHSELKPLLHTWSLSVEEQFYIFFPLLWIFLSRHSQRVKYGSLLLISVISLCWATRAAFVESTPAFYLMPFRAWELLVGCILAAPNLISRHSQKARNCLSLAGLVAIIVPLFTYGRTTVFPGASALAPCLGAAAIIYSCKINDTFVARLLNTQPLPLIGNLSYSLYLWHWPILSFLRHFYAIELTLIQSFSGLVGTAVFSYFSFKFIEAPLLKDSRKNLPYLRIGMTGIVAGLILAGAVFLLKGIPQRFDASSLHAFSAVDDVNPRRSLCQGDGSRLYAEACIFGDSAVPPDMAVWGDSHGGEIVEALGARLEPLGRSVLALTAMACPPSKDYFISEVCKRRNDDALAHLTTDTRIRTVVLTANFHRYSEIDYPKMLTGFKKSVEAIRLSGKRVIVVYPIPIFSFDPPSTIGIRNAYGRDTSKVGISVSEFEKMNREAKAMLDSLQLSPSDIIVPQKYLCDDSLCAAQSNDGTIRYFNNDHLGVNGAKLLANEMQL